MRENEFSPLGKAAVVLLFGLAMVSTGLHIAIGVVPNPKAFWVVIIGFLLFAIGKLSVITKGQWVSFGTALMSENMANTYRLGYWLMVVGILYTFA